jgi:phosphate transport system substrate-binding protein
MKANFCSRCLTGKASTSLYFLFMFLMAGCGSKSSSDRPIEGKVVIKGSNTIGEELGPTLIAEYKKVQPKVTIELESKGTASGFAGLFAGQCDMAGASRVVSHDELELARSKRVEFNVYTIGSYSVAVVLNATNKLTNLSRDNVRDIFTGTVQNWREVGGPDAAIQTYIRDPISGTYLGFKELAMENKDYVSTAKTFTNYAGIVAAVAQDPNGIGYASFDLLKKPGVKAVSIRGVSPTALTVNEGQYPVSRLLRFYTTKGKEAPAARDFLRFVQSPKGQEIIEEAGFVRLF